MWASVTEQKSQIKIEQPYDDSVTVKHLQRRERQKERERERHNWMKGQMEKQTGDEGTEGKGVGAETANSETVKHQREQRNKEGEHESDTDERKVESK